MKRSLLCLLVLLTLLSGLLVTTTRVAHAASSSCINPTGTNVLQGTLGGVSYVIAVPSNWNGTLMLYSHGYVFPGQPNPAPTAALTGVFAAGLRAGWFVLQPDRLGHPAGLPRPDRLTGFLRCDLRYSDSHDRFGPLGGRSHLG